MRRRADRALPIALAATLLLAACVGCGRAGSHQSSSARKPSEPSTASAPATATTTPAASAVTTFAIIGDYGSGDAHESAAASLVASWDPAYVLATGDDYYRQAGGSGTGRYDRSTGRYYRRWLKDVASRTYSGEATRNAFFPVLGNHDYSDATPSPRTYLAYFALPGAGFANSSGNERYYDFVEGPVHFFALNSNPDEPDGTSAESDQARWLKAQLAKSTSAWNVVYDHHPPYSSDKVHGSTPSMQWPFADWGADVVVSGHAHVYEHLRVGGLDYVIDGLGGAQRYAFGRAVSGSVKRFSADWGAERVIVTSSTLEFAFYDVSGKRIDRFRLRK